MEIINFIVTNEAVIFGMLWAMSEVIGLIPSVKSNSIFEIVVGILQKLIPKAPATVA